MSFAHALRPRAFLAGALALAAAATAVPDPVAAQGARQEIVITITRVRAIDKLDNFSRADFMARVSIDGDQLTTQRVRQQDDIRPNWVIAKRVAPGRHEVKLAVLDQDATKAESIDINRINGKRDLDFTVDTRSCTILGFASPFKCGRTIVRAGRDAKAAEIEFKVEVKKL